MAINSSEVDPHDFILSRLTHICLVSKEAAANLLPIVFFRPKKVVFFVSEQMKEAVDKLNLSSRDDFSSTGQTVSI